MGLFEPHGGYRRGDGQADLTGRLRGSGVSGPALKCGRIRQGAEDVPVAWAAGTFGAFRGKGVPLRPGPCPAGRQVREGQRPAPDPAGEKRPPRAGRALAGGFGPRLDKDQRGAVAGAMAPAIDAVTALSSVRAGPGNAIRVSPARAGRCPVDRQVRERQRSAPDPAGSKRPPGAGRALARALVPRPGKDQPGAGPRAMAPGRMLKAHAGAGVSRFPVRQPVRPALF